MLRYVEKSCDTGYFFECRYDFGYTALQRSGDDEDQKVRSADDVFDIYERSVGGNSTFLLNIPPNREGMFSPTDVSVLEEVGQRINDTYGVNLLSSALGPKEVLDNDLSTFKLLGQGAQEMVIETNKCLLKIIIEDSFVEIVVLTLKFILYLPHYWKEKLNIEIKLDFLISVSIT